MNADISLDSFLKYESYDHESWDELIDGQDVPMLGTGWTKHATVRGNLQAAFANGLSKRAKHLYFGNLFIAEANRYVPDLMVVGDESQIQELGVFGAPELVGEVLTRWSAVYDRGRKMEIYASSGVREYWIADAESRTIEQYVLDGGRYRLQAVACACSDAELAKLSEAERGEIQRILRCRIYDEIQVDANEIFGGID
ncbi:MAG: Uma2 family endonuclease [Oscillospiraceae bacterium]|nr:Uma2 family endonuclease [Oscillospiraceae bacterium]